MTCLMAVKTNLFLYTDDSCLMCQYRDVEEIEKQLNKDFEKACGWFVDDKLIIHFDRIKPNLFFLQVSVKSKVQENYRM